MVKLDFKENQTSRNRYPRIPNLCGPTIHPNRSTEIQDTSGTTRTTYFHAPIPGPIRFGGSEPSSGCETITRTLYLFFFLITTSKYHIHIKRTTTGVVSIKIYIYRLSPIYIYKTVLLHLQLEYGTYCDEPLLVCWPSHMRKLSNVISYTYTD